MEFLYLLLFAFNSFGALFLMVIGFTVLEKNRNRGGIFFFIFSIGYGIYQLLSQITEAGFDSFSLELLNLLTMSSSIIVILTAPLLFFSILYLLNSAYQFKAVHILILIPLIPALITVLILGMIGEYGMFFFTEQNVILNSLFLASHTLYMTVYITAVLLLMIMLARRISKSERSPVLLVLSIVFILLLGRDIADITGLYTIAGLLMTLTVLFIYLVLLFKPSLITVFARQMRLQHYKQSRLTGFSINTLSKNLNKLILEKQPYLNPDLKNRELASKIGLTSVQLSELLNLHYGVNFNQFINKHRIHFAKQQIESHPDRSVLEIAFLCGFNSSSAFYSAYRRITGGSPRKT